MVKTFNKVRHSRFVKVLFARKAVVFCMIVLSVMVLASVFAPVVAPYGYNDQDYYNVMADPSAEYPLGTDALGRDILSRLIYGGRVSFSVGLLSVFIAAFIGILLGLIAGMSTGLIGIIIMRIMDAISSVPMIILSLFLSAILGKGLFNMHELRGKMQMIFQDPSGSLDPRMSVKDLIGEPLKNFKACKNNAEYEAKVAEVMETVGLAERFRVSYSHELDGGRRQRIGIGRALAMNPEFVVCDEPVSALDVSVQAQVLNLLMDLQDEKDLTYVFITHDLSVVKHISDKIMVMYLGQCIEYAGTEELFRNPCHPYTTGLLAAVPVPSLTGNKLSMNVMRGELTSPIEPEPGCRFAARCPYASEKCKHRDIPLREIAPEHSVACVLFED